MAVHTEQTWQPRSRRQVSHRSYGGRLPIEFDPDETLSRLAKRALGHLAQYVGHDAVCAHLRAAMATVEGLRGACVVALGTLGQYTAADDLCEDMRAVLEQIP